MTRRVALVVAVLLASAGTVAPPQQQRARGHRPLVVVLIVDQMRAQYLDDYGSRFTGGLKRLRDDGAWFRQAAYPYLNTVTCPGHSTIGTGSFPYRHGMVLNAWWDRKDQRLVSCTSDASVKNIGYMGQPSGGDSATWLLMPPLAQQIHDKTGGRSVALSLKPRSAITMVGKNPSVVLWFDDRAGWSTSSAFSDKPIEWLRTFIATHPVEADRGRTWARLLPPAEYHGDDAGQGERPVPGWTATFPHAIGQPSTQFFAQWQRSPFADAYLGRLGEHVVDTLDLGRGKGTDFISISFSTLDLVGHQYGPASHEVQDVLFRLDRTIGAFLDHLDARLGRDNYVVALGADHGVAEIPEQSGAGREPAARISAAIENALSKSFGPGKYVAQTAYTDVYLAPGIFDKLRSSPAVSAAVVDAVRALPGIARVFRKDEIAGADARRSNDPVRRAAALSYYAPRSGDLIVVPERNWLLSTAATTHGTLYPYDQRVPVMFYGAGVPRGVRDTPATPADIAPTLASLAGVPFAATDGVALLRR